MDLQKNWLIISVRSALISLVLLINSFYEFLTLFPQTGIFSMPRTVLFSLSTDPTVYIRLAGPWAHQMTWATGLNLKSLMNRPSLENQYDSHAHTCVPSCLILLSLCILRMVMWNWVITTILLPCHYVCPFYLASTLASVNWP